MNQVLVPSDSDFQIIQINGQRIYSPKTSSNIVAPQKGSEIFVGRLPRHIFENRLLKIFSECGPIYKIRLMLDFTGYNRGYAFITYFSKENARNAVETFNNFILERHSICVSFSIDNCRLFIGSVPRDINKADVKIALRGLVEGVKDVIMYKDFIRPDFNRGYAFVEFEDHAKAAIARRKLSLGNTIIWNRRITVDWAEPIPQISEDLFLTLSRLYVSNLPPFCTSENLYNILTHILNKGTISKVHKETHYAFIHFKNKESAEDAFYLFQGIVIDGYAIKVEWARPPQYSKKHMSEANINHSCWSVSPKTRRFLKGTNSPQHSESSLSSVNIDSTEN